MTDRVFNVLFLCTGNSARSILAESILRKDGAGRFRAFSAGRHPKATVNPFALNVLRAFDYPTDGFRSKSWDEFAPPDAPQMDFVFTVCDDAAGETCPVWPGHPMTAHWGIEDPAAVEGSEVEKERAFNAAFRYMRDRMTCFVALPFASLDKMALRGNCPFRRGSLHRGAASRHVRRRCVVSMALAQSRIEACCGGKRT